MVKLLVTLWFWFAVAFFSLMILGSLPGVRDLVRPLISASLAALLAAGQLAGGYLLWLIKTLVRAHGEISRHLLHSNSYFDPSKDVRGK